MPDYKCSNCGKEYNWYDGSIKKEGKMKYCGECEHPLISIKTGEPINKLGQVLPEWPHLTAVWVFPAASFLWVLFFVQTSQDPEAADLIAVYLIP